MSLNHTIMVYILWVQPMLQFSIYLSMISIESTWALATIGGIVTSGCYFQGFISLLHSF